MRNAETGDLAATSEKISVFFDMEARSKLPLPEELRARMAANIVTRDD
jgi:acyl-CoA thioesterase FadM